MCGFNLLVFFFLKMWKILEKRPFFRGDMAGLGKYNTAGYGWFGVYRSLILVVTCSHAK